MADLTKDALARRVESLSGGAPIPQADTAKIATQLLGPDLASRYGDVLGIRPTSVRDIARDFSVGVISGDPTKADQLKSRVVSQYNEEARREQEAAIARDAEDRQKLDGLFGAIRESRKAPKKFRKEFLRDSLARIGMQASPIVEKMITEPEEFPGSELIGNEDMYRRAQDNPQEALAQATQLLGDPQVALSVVKHLQSVEQNRIKTQNLILEGNRKQAGIEQDRQQSARAELQNPRVAATNELTARQQGLANKDQPYNPLFAGKTDEEVQAFGLAGGEGRGAKAQSPLDAVMAEAFGKTKAPAAPGAGAKVTVRKLGESVGPVGIPQEPAPAASAAPTPLSTTGLLR